MCLILRYQSTLHAVGWHIEQHVSAGSSSSHYCCTVYDHCALCVVHCAFAVTIVFVGAFAATHGALKTLQLGGLDPGDLTDLSSQTLTLNSICHLYEQDLQQILRSCVSLAELRVRNCMQVPRGACHRLLCYGAADVKMWWSLYEEFTTDDEEDVKVKRRGDDTDDE